MRYVHACYSCLQRANSAQIPFWKQRSECATSKWNAGQAYSPSYVALGRVLCDQFHDQERRGSTMIEAIILICAGPGSASSIYSLLAVGVRGQRSGNRGVEDVRFVLRRVGVKGSCKGSPKK